MAKKPENPTGAEGGAGKPGGRGQGRQPKQSRQEGQPETSVGSHTQGAGATPAEQPPLRWRRLAGITISTNELCDEVTRMASRWPHSKRIDRKVRIKVADDVKRLAVHGEIVQRRACAFINDIEERPEDSAPHRTEAGWRRLQGFGLTGPLQQLIATLRRIEHRLRTQYSSEAMDRINEDFHSLTGRVSRTNNTAATVRESLRKRLDKTALSPEITYRLNVLIKAITAALAGSSSHVLDTFPDHAPFADRLPKQLDRVKAIRVAYTSLRSRIKEECKDVRQVIFDQNKVEMTRINDFLETIDDVLFTARGTEEYASMVEEAATRGIDTDVTLKVEELKKELAAIRNEETLLDDLIYRYRDIIALAPFKRVERPPEMPLLENLDEMQRRVLVLLIDVRAWHPDGELYSVVRKELEQRLDVGANDSSLNRALTALDETYQLVGKYQPLRSITRPQPACGFWIEEYAYAHYGPYVLGEAWVPPTDP